jgi:hypothetical protein
LESTYASPGPYARLIRTGTFPGRWHNDAIDFEFKEFDKSKFQGVATFTGGVHAGSRFDFTGELSTNGELSIDRTLPGGKQQSVRAGRWSIKNGEYVWQAKTTGLHASDRPFELRVPSMIKLGSFEGKWHGDPVTFRIVEIFANGLFSGVAKFTAGPHAGFEFVFTSEVDMFTGIGGLKINRNTESGIQSVTAFYPKLVNGVFVWRGFTTGVGAGNRIFELQIPQ